MWNSYLVLSSWLSSPRTSFPVPQDSVSSYCHSWECAVGSWMLFRTSFLALHETELRSNSCSPGWLEALESCGGSFLALRRFLDTKLIGPGFATADTFFSRSFLGSLGHDTLLSVSSGCQKTSRNSWCSTFEEDGHIHHVWNYLWSTCPRVDFWCQHFWFGSWVPNWFCRTTNQGQLCGFLTRVSPLAFCPWWSFWSLLRYLQRCTTETHPDENVRLWWRSPHVTITCDNLIIISVSLLFGFGFVISRAVSCCPMGWWFGTLRRT